MTGVPQVAASKLKISNPRCKIYLSLTIQIFRDSEKTKLDLFAKLNLALQIIDTSILSLRGFDKLSRFTHKQCGGIHVCVFSG